MIRQLRHAHERNDEVLERIYLGRRFRNDTERLEKLFELYPRMIADAAKKTPRKRPPDGRHSRAAVRLDLWFGTHILPRIP